jgi:RHS repeat-associated protein
MKATYRWLSDGTKAGVTGYNSSSGDPEGGFEYLGSLIYVRDPSGLQLESAPWAGGRILKTSNSYQIQYFLTDHLGSVRYVVGQDSGSSTAELLQTNGYYPFGKRWESPSMQASTNRWQFNGNEKQITGGLDYLDYSARMYDADLTRWFTVDPLSGTIPWESPYLYCGGNPISRIDHTLMIGSSKAIGNVSDSGDKL